LQKRYTNEEITLIYNRNVDSVYRVCFVHMRNHADAEDMTADAFLKMIKRGVIFESPEHERAWLIRVAVNLCRNSFKSLWSKTLPLEEGDRTTFIPEPDEVLERVMKLPRDIKTALYLYYYEGYATADIARITGKPESTVRGYLHRGRGMLKKEIEKEELTYGL